MEHLRDCCAMVLQKNTLFSGTIRENLLWGNEHATEEEINAACAAACADEFIGRLPGGLDMDLGQGGVNVSGGQKQRLCIARAILKKPKVLILDDSTSALDMETEKEIQRQLQELKNCTKIIIGHRISAVQNADQILILENGRVAERGTHEELLKKRGLYYQTFKVQYGEEEMEWQ